MPSGDPYLVPLDSATKVRTIAQQAGVDPDIADDYLKLTRIESGSRQSVRDSSKGAKGFGQVMPDQKGGKVRTVGNRKYDLTDESQNIEAGLRYFAEGGNDPVARRLYYFGGPRARAHYQKTGQIPNISDGNMTAAQYVKATGGARSKQSPQDPYLAPLPKGQSVESDPYLAPLEATQPTPEVAPITKARISFSDVKVGRIGQQTKSYDTPLSPQEESQFQVWKQQYAPRDSGVDYDLRGAFKAGLKPDPRTRHWPDTFKKPNHPTFSNQSQYATGADAAKAGTWGGSRFIPSQSTRSAPLTTQNLQGGAQRNPFSQPAPRLPVLDQIQQVEQGRRRQQATHSTPPEKRNMQWSARRYAIDRIAEEEKQRTVMPGDPPLASRLKQRLEAEGLQQPSIGLRGKPARADTPQAVDRRTMLAEDTETNRVLNSFEPPKPSLMQTPEDRAKTQAFREDWERERIAGDAMLKQRRLMAQLRNPSTQQSALTRILDSPKLHIVAGKFGPEIAGDLLDSAAGLLRFVDTAGNTVEGNSFVSAGIKKMRDLGAFLQGSAQVEPQGAAESFTAGGAGMLAQGGKYVALASTTGLPFWALLGSEAAIKTQDQPVPEQAKAVSEAILFGLLIDKGPGLVAKGLGKMPGVIGKTAQRFPRAIGTTVTAGGFGVMGAEETLRHGGTVAEAAGKGLGAAASVAAMSLLHGKQPGEAKPVVRHSDPRIDGGEIIGRTNDGRLKIQNNEGGVSVVKNPRTQGNREATIVKPQKPAEQPQAETPTVPKVHTGPNGEPLIETAFRPPRKGEFYLFNDGGVGQADHDFRTAKFPILERAPESPAQRMEAEEATLQPQPETPEAARIREQSEQEIKNIRLAEENRDAMRRIEAEAQEMERTAKRPESTPTPSQPAEQALKFKDYRELVKHRNTLSAAEYRDYHNAEIADPVVREARLSGNSRIGEQARVDFANRYFAASPPEPIKPPQGELNVQSPVQPSKEMQAIRERVQPSAKPTTQENVAPQNREMDTKVYYAGNESGKPRGQNIFLTENPEYAQNFGSEVKQYQFTPKNTFDLTDAGERALSLVRFKQLMKRKGVDISDFKGESGTPEEYQTTKPAWQWLRKHPELIGRIKAAGFDSIAQQETFTGRGPKEKTLQVLDDANLEQIKPELVASAPTKTETPKRETAAERFAKTVEEQGNRGTTLYGGLPIPTMKQLSDIVRDVRTGGRKLMDVPSRESFQKIKEPIDRMIAQHREVRGVEFESERLKLETAQAIKDMTPEQQTAIIDAMEHNYRGPYWDVLSPEQKAVARTLKPVHDLIEEYNRKHDVFTERVMPPGTRHVFHWWLNPKTGRPFDTQWGEHAQSGPSSRQRTIETYAEGRERTEGPMTMASTNPGEILGKSFEQMVRVKEARELIDSLKKWEMTDKRAMLRGIVSEPPKGLEDRYERIDIPALKRQRYLPQGEEGPGLLVQQPVYALKELAPKLRAYFEKPDWTKLDEIMFAAKSVKLAGTFFHGLGLMFKNMTMFRFRNVHDIRRGLNQLHGMDDVMKRGYQNGLETALKREYTDLSEAFGHFQKNSLAGRAMDLTHKNPITNIVFNVVRSGLKNAYFHDTYLKMEPRYIRAAEKEAGRPLTDREIEKAKNTAARAVVERASNLFSGEDLQLGALEASNLVTRLYFSPKARRIWQKSLISPTWQREHLIEAKNLVKSVTMPRRMGPIAREHVKQAFGVVTILAVADLTNWFMTRWMDEEGHHLWSNPSGSKFSIRLPWNDPSYEVEDKNGKKRTVAGGPAYVRPFKAITEVPELISAGWDTWQGATGNPVDRDIVDKISSKVHPVWQLAAEQATFSKQKRAQGTVERMKAAGLSLLPIATDVPIRVARRRKNPWALVPWVIGAPTQKPVQKAAPSQPSKYPSVRPGAVNVGKPRVGIHP